MKVGLVYLDISTGYYPSVHHGLAFLASHVKAKGHEVYFKHLFTKEMLATCWQEIQHVDVVGISLVTNQLRYFEELHSNCPSKFQGNLVVGGVHPTLMYEEMLQKYKHVHTVCVGEGEIAFASYLEALQTGDDTSVLEGFACRDVTGSVRINKLRQYTALEKLSFPDYTIFNLPKIVAHASGTFPMMLSRGCPYSCSYCSNHALQHAYDTRSGYVRIPEPSHAVAMVQSNLDQHDKVSNISFADDTFTLNKKWVSEFCGQYKTEVGLPFDCNARVENIEPKTLEVLKNAGCHTLHFGLESGSEWLRRNVLKRPQSNQNLLDALKLAKAAGFKITTSTITALPFETQAMFDETYKMVREARPHFGSCFFFYPYPKTDLWKTCTQFDLLLPGYEKHSGYLEGPSIRPIFLSYRQIKENYSKMRYYFMLRVGTTRVKAPGFVENALVRLSPSLFRKKFVRFMTGQSNLKYFIRKIGYRVKSKPVTSIGSAGGE